MNKTGSKSVKTFARCMSAVALSLISKNWSGEPLETYEKALKLIRTTKTSTGLKVKAHFVRKHYKTGEKVSDSEMDSL